MNYPNRNRIQQVEQSNFHNKKIFTRNNLQKMDQSKSKQQIKSQQKIKSKQQIKSKQGKYTVYDQEIQQKSEKPFMLQSKSRHLTQQSQTQQCSYPLYYQSSSSNKKAKNNEFQPAIQTHQIQQNKISQRISCGEVFSFILFVGFALIFVGVFSFMIIVQFGGLQLLQHNTLVERALDKIGLRNFLYQSIQQYYDYQNQYLLTDTQGTQCNKLGSPQSYNLGKLYPYLYLDIDGQNITKYCVSMCPSGNPQFDRQTVQIYSGSFIALRHQKPSSVFKFTSLQSPSNIFPGLCISQQKLSLIEKADPLFYIEIMQRQAVVKAFTYGFWIVVVFAVATLAADLLLKTNLLSSSSNRSNPYLRYDFLVIISVGLLLIILTCILLGFDIYQRYHLMHSLSASTPSSLSQQQFYLSITLLIISTFILQYFLYNIFFRYNKIIDTAIHLLKEAEQNINKIRFILYSIVAMVIMLVIILNMGFAFLYTNRIINHHQFNDIIKISTIGLLTIMSLYCYNFIKQLFLYAVTYESLKEITKSTINKQNQDKKSITFITFKDFCKISKSAIINAILFIPIKVVQIINLNYNKQQQESNCLSSIANSLNVSCFCMFGFIINKVHQISLNPYTTNMMVNKFELIQPISNKLTNYQLNCLHHLYSSSYTKATQRSSFYLYCLSQWIIKLFIVFTLHFNLQDPNLQVDKYRSFSIALITSLAVCIISSFSRDYIFTNAEIVELQHILTQIQTNKLLNQQNFQQNQLN